MPTHLESVWGQEVTLEHLIQDRCVTTNPTFQMLGKEREVMEVDAIHV